MLAAAAAGPGVELGDVPVATSAERVTGWDFLRGLCALAVAGYHLCYWLELAQIHTVGSYGVHLFFVLSGASLAYTYVGRMSSGLFSFGEFLFVRFWRLAPLYVVLMLMVLPQLAIWTGPLPRLLSIVFLNASFLMGVYQPSTHAILTGGWSLGVEAMFYLAFPWMIWACRSWRRALTVLLGLAALQIAWISLTLGSDTSQAAMYYNAPGFAAYFMGGCLLGVLQRRWGAAMLQHPAIGLAIIAAGWLLMLLANPAQAPHELLGWRGFLLGTLCFVMVAAAGSMQLRKALARTAQHLGDATYGVYLIHPVLFFYAMPALGLEFLKTARTGERVALALVLLLVTFGLALASERYFEQPVRRWSKSIWMKIRGRAHAMPPEQSHSFPNRRHP